MKQLLKIPGASIYLAHRCNHPDCGIFFRTEEEKLYHEANESHCNSCGLGYSGISINSVRTCPACWMDFQTFPEKKV